LALALRLAYGPAVIGPLARFPSSGRSIHHLSTSDKLRLMTAIRGAVGVAGIFMLYEPTCRAGRGLSGVSESV
jgi:hypothetical protein